MMTSGMRTDLLPSSRRSQLLDTDVTDAAKAVSCAHVRKHRSRPELALRNARTVERIAPTFWSGEDRERSRTLQLVLQLLAGHVFRVDACRYLRAVRLDRIGCGDNLGGVAIAWRRQHDRRERRCS